MKTLKKLALKALSVMFGYHASMVMIATVVAIDWVVTIINEDPILTAKILACATPWMIGSPIIYCIKDLYNLNEE
jgi:hypothetical protein